jgi:hypothetical protein
VALRTNKVPPGAIIVVGFVPELFSTFDKIDPVTFNVFDADKFRMYNTLTDAQAPVPRIRSVMLVPFVYVARFELS